MALTPLPIAIPLLGGGRRSPPSSTFCRDGSRTSPRAAIAAASTVLCVLLIFRSAHHDVVHWAGGWKPSHGIALGVALRRRAARRRARRARRHAHDRRARLRLALLRGRGAARPGDPARLPRRDGRLHAERRPLQHVRLVRADERLRVRALPATAMRDPGAASGRDQLRGHEHDRRAARAVGHRARLRTHRRAQPRPDRRVARHAPPGRAGRRVVRLPARRLPGQGGRGAVPLLARGRLRGRTRAGVRRVRGRDERPRAARDRPHLLAGVRRDVRAARALGAGDPGRGRVRDDARRRRDVVPRAQPEADARVRHGDGHRYRAARGRAPDAEGPGRDDRVRRRRRADPGGALPRGRDLRLPARPRRRAPALRARPPRSGRRADAVRRRARALRVSRRSGPSSA